MRSILYKEEMHLAALKDAAVRTIKSKGYVDMLRSERSFNILNETFLELNRQIEVLSFKIANSRHNISIVDKPMLPLKGKRKGIGLTVLIFSIIGFVVGVVLLIGFPIASSVFKKLKKA